MKKDWNVGFVLNGYRFMCEEKLTEAQKDDLVAKLKEKVGDAYIAMQDPE